MKFVQNQLPAFIWIVIIFWLSSLHHIPDFKIPMEDKIAHLCFYAVLCGLSFRAFLLQDRFPAVSRCALCGAMLFTVLYGLADEIHQIFVWGRTSDVLDLATDTLGGLLFVIAMTIYQKRKSDPTARVRSDTRV